MGTLGIVGPLGIERLGCVSMLRPIYGLVYISGPAGIGTGRSAIGLICVTLKGIWRGKGWHRQG